jgi:hypothetical protein
VARRRLIQGPTGWLKAEHPDYQALELKEGLDYVLLDVIRHQIHSV